MKKKMSTTVFALLLSLCSITVFTAKGQVAPISLRTDSFNLSRVYTHDSLSATFINISSTHVDLYFKTPYDTDTSMIFASKQDFYNNIVAAGDQLSRIRRLAYIVKSDRFRNNFLKFANYNNFNYTEAETMSVPMFALGASQEQCGNYRDFCIKVLIETGTVSPDSIFQLSLCCHQLAAYITNGDTAVLDFDPDEPTFLNVDSNGRFLSPSELANAQNNPLIAGAIYTYCDPVDDQCAWMVDAGGDINVPDSATQTFMLDSQYVAMFPGYQYNQLPIFAPDPDSGIVRLPAGASLTFHMTMGYVLTPSQTDTITYLFQHLRTDTDVYNLFVRLESIFAIDSNQLQAMFKYNQMTSQLLTDNRLVLHDSYQKWNTVHFSLITGNDTVFIGRDLKMPFWVHTITTTIIV